MPAPVLSLRVLATTDLHCALLPWDYFTDRPIKGQGLAQLAPVIRRMRAEAPNTLLFDNGDMVQGNPMADVAASVAFDGPHPMIAAMSALGYDAAAIGNHEFDYGLPFLRRVIDQSDFPFVCANLYRVGGGMVFASEVLLSRHMRDNCHIPEGSMAVS